MSSIPETRTAASVSGTSSLTLAASSAISFAAARIALSVGIQARKKALSAEPNTHATTVTAAFTVAADEKAVAAEAARARRRHHRGRRSHTAARSGGCGEANAHRSGRGGVHARAEEVRGGVGGEGVSALPPQRQTTRCRASAWGGGARGGEPAPSEDPSEAVGESAAMYAPRAASSSSSDWNGGGTTTAEGGASGRAAGSDRDASCESTSSRVTLGGAGLAAQRVDAE